MREIDGFERMCMRRNEKSGFEKVKIGRSGCSASKISFFFKEKLCQLSKYDAQ